MTEMDEGARGWLIKTAKENLWRVPAWVELEDLIEDGLLVYHRVILKYEERDYVSPSGYVTKKSRRVRSRAHIQRLFQMAYTFHLNDLANKRTECGGEVMVRDLSSRAADAIEGVVWDVFAPTPDALAHEQLICDAPYLVRRLLVVMTKDERLPAMLSRYRVAANGYRETLNDRLCRLIGVDPKMHDLATALRDYLTGDEPLAA
jgi:hypothetical protein